MVSIGTTTLSRFGTVAAFLMLFTLCAKGEIGERVDSVGMQAAIDRHKCPTIPQKIDTTGLPDYKLCTSGNTIDDVHCQDRANSFYFLVTKYNDFIEASCLPKTKTTDPSKPNIYNGTANASGFDDVNQLLKQLPNDQAEYKRQQKERAEQERIKQAEQQNVLQREEFDMLDAARKNREHRAAIQEQLRREGNYVGPAQCGQRQANYEACSTHSTQFSSCDDVGLTGGACERYCRQIYHCENQGTYRPAAPAPVQRCDDRSEYEECLSGNLPDSYNNRCENYSLSGDACKQQCAGWYCRSDHSIIPH